MTDVIWKPIPGTHFEASSRGEIRNAITGRVRRLNMNEHGYLRLRLGFRGPTVFAHRLVASAFHGPPPPGMVVNHIDSNRSNNTPSNLEWVTMSGNSLHAHRTGRIRKDGEHSPAAVLTDAIVTECRRRYTLGGVRFAELAAEFGVSKTAIRNAVKGTTWGHLPGAAVGDFRSSRSTGPKRHSQSLSQQSSRS